MKKRYILLILLFLFGLYIIWCNISIIYTRTPNSNKNIPLVAKINYPSDSFSSGNATLLWQGFYHIWTYNHRVNRMGDWIQSITHQDDHVKAVFNHSAATGLGGDILDYTTYFTYLKSNKIRSFSSEIQAIVRGREATSTTKIITVKGKLPEGFKKNQHAFVVLNGFDLYVRNSEDGKIMGTGKADKLSDLIIDVQRLKIENDSFQFDLTISLGADCDSPECLNFTPGDNEWFDYNFTVAYQVIGYNDNVLVTSNSLKQYYRWFKPFTSRPNIDPNEIYREQKAFYNVKLKGASGYNIGIPLINKLEIHLPKEEGGLLRKRLETPHMLSLNIAITRYMYQPSTGICTYNADLFFKNWKPGMPFYAYGNNGKAYINLGLKLLQINDPTAIAEASSIKGFIKWQTADYEDRNANDPNSVKTFIFEK